MTRWGPGIVGEGITAKDGTIPPSDGGSNFMGNGHGDKRLENEVNVE